MGVAAVRVSQKEMERSHDRIVGEAARLFRKSGIEQTGVKDVMSAAGMTHGGFYRHFASKDELVAEALDAAFDDMMALLKEGAGGEQDEAAFERQRDFYLSDQHLSVPEGGCPAAALGSEIGRGSDDLRTRFGFGIERVVARLADSFAGAPLERRKQAYREFAMMAGAAILARASDSETGARILEAVRGSAVGAGTSAGRQPKSRPKGEPR